MSKKQLSLITPDEVVISKIYLIRGKKVMIDRDLAELYGIETKQLKRQVKRNIDRFPDDFMFELTAKEFKNWRSQFGTSIWADKMGLRYPPYAFTEHGVLMLSSILNSNRAIQANIQIMRIYTKLREMILTNKDIIIKLEQLEMKLLKQDEHLNKHEEDIQMIFNALKQLLNPPADPRKRIGYKTSSSSE